MSRADLYKKTLAELTTMKMQSERNFSQAVKRNKEEKTKDAETAMYRAMWEYIDVCDAYRYVYMKNLMREYQRELAMVGAIIKSVYHDDTITVQRINEEVTLADAEELGDWLYEELRKAGKAL